MPPPPHFEGQGSFLDEIRAACGESWAVDPSGPWIGARPGGEVDDSGWKLHVSATPDSCEEVLGRILPLLVAEQVPFKVSSSAATVLALNEGEGGLTQVGKFATVYPQGPEDAVRIAARLHAATRGLRGPRPPSDRKLGPGGIVTYRFDGPAEPADDPFVDAGLAVRTPASLLGGRYAVARTLSRSPGGAVHLAADVEGGRSAVVKQAIRDARISPDGRDARDRLRHEAGILRRLAGTAPVPNVFETFEENEDLFLAMEFIEGPTLGEATRSREPARAVSWGCAISDSLQHVHDAGIVYRDLNPPNVIASPRGMFMIDFEIASEAGRVSDAAGTAGYWSPQQAEGHAASFADDAYAFGATLFFLATGEDPPEWGSEAIAGTRVWRGVSAPLQEVISRCTATDPAGRPPSMREVSASLEAIR